MYSTTEYLGGRWGLTYVFFLVALFFTEQGEGDIASHEPHLQRHPPPPSTSTKPLTFGGRGGRTDQVDVVFLLARTSRPGPTHAWPPLKPGTGDSSTPITYILLHAHPHITGSNQPLAGAGTRVTQSMYLIEKLAPENSWNDRSDPS